ncbi:CoA transferase [Microbacterium sp. NPDC096154]|uniref:CoA transferase n=1 Tax=Microbacterium sp. NPDC096154 TaxID=3155549 RepID=UPI00331BFC67
MVGDVGRAAAAALGLPGAALERIAPVVEPPAWSSTLRVAALATDSVALASLALDLAAEARGAGGRGPVVVDGPRVAASFASDRVLRVDGEKPDVWSPLSGFWRTADGWVRTHGNYPHHAERLRALLEVRDDASRDDLVLATAGWAASDLEDRAAEVGAIVAAVRDEATWREHPHARVLAAEPLIATMSLGQAAPRRWPASGPLPLSGIRVLDLTRVIAGPVATRDLAHAGAEVLRLDSPALPEIDWQHLDIGHGKRTALLDLRVDRDEFERLLTGADVLVTGYRPGALARYGLDEDSLAERHPGLVTARISAWGASGPWAHRRGFDSIVQATTGIAVRESADGETPGALPVQALDHSGGHLLAAAIATALVRQRTAGGSPHVAVALARIAQQLLASPPAERAPAATQDLPAQVSSVPGGPELTHAPPPLAFAGAPDGFAPPRPWGSDAASWSGG